MSKNNLGRLSLGERDRRWNAIRKMMQNGNLDCLILYGGVGDSFLKYTQYVSNELYIFADGAVVFPIDGEPTSFWGRPKVGEEMWISDRRGRPSLAPAIVARISELGLSEGTIGVVGLEGTNVFGTNAFTSEGWVPHKTWHYVEQNLPKARFQDITPRMAEIVMVKSPEELKLIEKTAAVGEHMHEYLLNVTKPGVTDRDVRVKIAESITSEGAMFDVAALEMRPGVVSEGDIINSEYGILYGDGGYAQVTLCMAVGNVSKETARLAEVAEACLKVGLETLKPGSKFQDVIDPMEKVVADAGFWHGFPLLHNINPLVLVGPVRFGPPPAELSPVLGAETVVKKGMTFSYEAGARIGPLSQVKIGGTAIVTNSGVRMLNSIGKKLQIV